VAGASLLELCLLKLLFLERLLKVLRLALCLRIPLIFLRISFFKSLLLARILYFLICLLLLLHIFLLYLIELIVYFIRFGLRLTLALRLSVLIRRLVIICVMSVIMVLSVVLLKLKLGLSLCKIDLGPQSVIVFCLYLEQGGLWLLEAWVLALVLLCTEVSLVLRNAPDDKVDCDIVKIRVPIVDIDLLLLGEDVVVCVEVVYLGVINNIN